MDCTIPTSLMVRNELVREGLKRILVDHDFPVAHSIATPEDLDFTNTDGDHILIYDGSPFAADDDLSGVEDLIDRLPRARIVLLVETFDFELMNRAFAAGIYGYILQNTPVECFVSMVRLVSLGQKVAPSELINMLGGLSRPMVTAAPSDIAKTYRLGEREVEILNCLTMGMPNKMISRKLGLSEATVKLNVKGIFRKMSVTNRTQAALLARDTDGTFPHE